jgi:transposase
VMQFAENLTDRQAADAVRDRIAWKYALSLELTHAGFDFSVLSEFRQRLLDHEAEQWLLDEMLEEFNKRGLLKTHGKQRTDSTHIVAAVRILNQLELVHETLRHALNDLAQQAPAWLRSWVSSEWFGRYGERASNSRLPKAKDKRQQWAERIGEDGLFLLKQVYRADTHPELATLPSIEILRQVWVQNFCQMHGKVQLRERKGRPPSAEQIASPYDLKARYSSKRDTSWIGYRVHMTETCNPDSPNLITHVETRVGAEDDHNSLESIHRDLAEKDYLPAEHIVDQGYMSVEALVESQQAYNIDLLGTLPENNNWQAREGGYDTTQFTIDWDNKRATCPQGKQSYLWRLTQNASQRSVVNIRFRREDCEPCSARNRCTRNTKHKRRMLTVLAPRAHYEAQQLARQRQHTIDFKSRYAVRAGVEGTMSQATVALGGRRSRYRGMQKTHFQYVAIAAAINLLRVLAWLDEVPRSVTRPSRFVALAV